METKNLNYIAILGCSNTESTIQRAVVEKLTDEIVLRNMGICSNTIITPIYFAFRQAKLVSGNTWLVSNAEISHKDRHLCDILEIVSTPIDKYNLIAKLCIGGIVISGGIETGCIADCFLRINKNIVAITGITDLENLSSHIPIKSNIENALMTIM